MPLFENAYCIVSLERGVDQTKSYNCFLDSSLVSIENSSLKITIKDTICSSKKEISEMKQTNNRC
jgi:hypothetical protein